MCTGIHVAFSQWRACSRVAHATRAALDVWARDRIGTCCALLLTTDTPCPTRVSDILAHARLFVCVKKCVAQDAHLHVESTDARKK